MTGKEALKLAQDTILAHNGNNKSSFTMKNLYLVEKELDKYKRAFEILNRDKELTLHKGKEPILGTDEYKLSFVNWKSLTKEEYELLEELMKDEK